MPSLPCILGTDCDKGTNGATWSSQDLPYDQAKDLLDMHLLHAHPPAHAPPNVAPQQQKAEKLSRPQLKIKDGQVTEEVWEFFNHQWETYKRQANLQANTIEHLEYCLGDEVTHVLFGRLGQTEWNKLTEQTLLLKVKEMFLKQRNRMVNRIKLHGLMQGPDQPVQQYIANLNQVARTCKFSVKCPNAACAGIVDYSDEIVLDQLVNGLNDSDIQKKVLSIEEANFNMDKVEKLIIAEEASKNTQIETKSTELNRLSTYKKEKRDPKDYDKPCRNCGEKGHWYRDLVKDDKKKCKAHGKKCEKCGRLNHLSEKCEGGGKKNGDVDHNLLSLFNISADQTSARSRRRTMNHMKFDPYLDKYVPTNVNKMVPVLPVSIKVDRENYNLLGGNKNSIFRDCQFERESVGDTGAALCCAPAKEIEEFGIKEEDLLQSSLNLFTADRRKLIITGCIPVNISTTSEDGKSITIKDILYFVDGLQKIFISKDALTAMGSITKAFPRVKSGAAGGVSMASMEPENKCIIPDTYEGETAECGCPLRADTPGPPELERQVDDYSTEELKLILLNHYRSSAFNTCQHQPLPTMHGPPLELKVDPKVKPTACHKPATVPAHWETKVKADLDRDVALGVIEEVPLNCPVDWCHRMVIQRKHNGDPRRTVDLQPLNKACQRQTHHTAPPFQQAMMVPHNTLKTKLDCWNGFHSVLVNEEDRHFLCFITPWGRYRYRTSPQGHLVSGDAYTHRYDKITAGVKDCKRVIDDSLLYDKDKESSFFHAVEYISKCGQNGIIFNPDKFEFCQDTVDWAGIKITPTTVEPLEEHVQAIRDYPTPTSLTDIRSFFALVEQVAPFYAAKPHLLPFRDLLKKNSRWYWDHILQELFDEAKKTIASKVIEGLTRFQLDRETGLITDWSKFGVGFILVQKYCQCTQITPDCCKGGWQVCMVGNRFNNKAEGLYAAIEGECLAVSYGLNKTKYYTLGCDKLTVAVDHKPLLGVLNDTELDNISNPRLCRLKEKTLGWNFNIVHIPGKNIGAPDAMSRLKQQISNNDDSGVGLQHMAVEDDQSMGTKELRTMIHAAMCSVSKEAEREDISDNQDALISSMESSIRSITWDMVRNKVKVDETSQLLTQWINAGCPRPADQLPEQIRPYWNVRQSLRVFDGVPMMGDRTIIPKEYRREVLQTLHSAHQGVYSMILRAGETVYWPGFVKDIEEERNRCYTCHKITPSQSNLPPYDPVIPDYPFQHICLDHFSLNGTSYGCFVDRFTNWAGVYHGNASQDVCDVLARLCEDYGIPETCSTDGAPNYTSAKVKKFMEEYGIQHRVSSVANAHSNCRAELGVKSMKRLIRDNLTVTGQINTVEFSRALLQYRNTKDRDTGVSPAKSLMGRELRDFVPQSREQLMNPVWHNLAEQRELALAVRGSKMKERLSANVKELKPLKVGDACIVQNQSGNYPKRWDKTGTIVAPGDFDQYQLRMDGSRRITLRNRKFLRKVDSFRDTYSPAPVLTHSKGPTTPAPAPDTTPAPVTTPAPAPDTTPAPVTMPAPPPVESPEPSELPMVHEEIIEIPREEFIEVPDQMPAPPTSPPSTQLNKLKDWNKPGLKENWSTESKLRPRKK